MDTSGLEASGYKSVRIVVGDEGSQVEQSMRIGLQGEAAPGWFIDARLVDEGLAAGELRVTSLEQVDEMFLRIMHGPGRLTLGDFRYEEDSMALFGINHQSMGADLEWRTPRANGQWALGQDPVQKVTVVFSGCDGQQTGYLVAEDGASDVAVVPGSESVWLNGKKLQEGVDYTLESTGGVLNFQGLTLPGSTDQIRVEYEQYTDDASKAFVASSGNLILGPVRLRLAAAGLWTDLDEYRTLLAALDSTESDTSDTDSSDTTSLDTLGLPQDMRISGVQIIWDAGNAGVLQMEGAMSRFDSNSLLRSVPAYWGHAARGTWNSPGGWETSRRGWQWFLEGAWQDSFFTNDGQTGTTQDWDSYTLEEDWELTGADSDRVERRFGQIHLGYSPTLQWRPWFSYGQRRIADTAKAQRVAGGLDHRSREVKSNISFADVISHQDGERQRVQGDWDAAWQKGIIRPFGSGSAFWRMDRAEAMEEIDFQPGAGFQYGISQDGWAGTFAVESERLMNRDLGDDHYEDSTGSAQVKHQLDVGNAKTHASSLLQWKRAWGVVDTSADTSGSVDSWIAEQSARWDFAAHHGSLTHHFGLTREHPLVAAYKRVATGTGDVYYDSTLQQFIEGVDYGDYVRDGYERADSLPEVEEGEISLTVEEWVSPGILLQIKHGLLRDIRLGIHGEWTQLDSNGAVYIPPFLWDRVVSSVEGLSSLEGLWEWSSPLGNLELSGKDGGAIERQLSSSGQLERRWWQTAEGTWRIAEHLRLMPEYERNVVHIAEPSVMRWLVQDATLRLSRTLPWDIETTPGMRYRWSEGSSEDLGSLRARLWQPSLGLSKRMGEGGEMRLTYSYTWMSTENESLPYRVMQGFSAGWTHRLQGSIDWMIGERLRLELSYLLRVEESLDSPVQKFSGEARAFF